MLLERFYLVSNEIIIDHDITNYTHLKHIFCFLYSCEFFLLTKILNIVLFILQTNSQQTLFQCHKFEELIHYFCNN
jgi:hypothetical protein